MRPAAIEIKRNTLHLREIPWKQEESSYKGKPCVCPLLAMPVDFFPIGWFLWCLEVLHFNSFHARLKA